MFSGVQTLAGLTAENARIELTGEDPAALTLFGESSLSSTALVGQAGDITVLGSLSIDDASYSLADFHGGITLGDVGTLSLSNDGQAFSLASISGAAESTLNLNGNFVVGDLSQYGGGINADNGSSLSTAAGTTNGGFNANASLSLAGSTFTNGSQVQLGSLTADGSSVIDVGAITIGNDYASGGILAGNASLNGTQIVADLSASEVAGDQILSVDNEAGSTVSLIRFDRGTAESIDVVLDPGVGSISSDLVQNERTVGTVSYVRETVYGDNSVGVNFKIDEIRLTDVLALNAGTASGEDAELRARVTGGNGTLSIDGGRVSIAAEGNSYGSLNVAEGAEAALSHDQTLASGGTIAGTVSGSGALNLTGGNLVVRHDQASLSIHAGAGSTVTFDGIQAADAILSGVTAGSGSSIAFVGTSGQFAVREGSSGFAYRLSDASSITFAHEAGSTFDTGVIAIDGTSEAHYDLTNADPGSVSVDMSDVSGAGKFAVSLSQKNDLTFAGIPQGFSGTLWAENANLYAGTNAAVAGEGTLSQFVGTAGQLRVGRDATLYVDNDMSNVSESGSINVSPLRFGNDLTLSFGSTLDFTRGIFSDDGTYLGNKNGVSANAVDMNGHDILFDAESYENGDIKVNISTKELNLGTGFEDTGYDGSILDLSGSVKQPVLAFVTDTGMSEQELSALAASMTLVTDSQTPDETLKLMQPSGPDGEKDYVADVTAGADIVVDRDNNGLAVGVAVKEVHVLDGKTFLVDPSVSTEAVAGNNHIFGATVTGSDSTVVRFSNDLGIAAGQRVTVTGSNTYLGRTEIVGGADVTAANPLAFAGSREVYVQNGELNVEIASSESVSTISNALNLKTLVADAGAAVRLGENNKLLLSAGESAFKADAAVTGGRESLIAVGGASSLTFDMANISAYEGAFAAAEGATVTFTAAEESEYEWKNSVSLITDYRGRAAAGAGEFIKMGAGTVAFGQSADLANMNLRVSEGKAVFNNARLGSLTGAAYQEVNGILTVGDLFGEKSGIFALDVSTGIEPSRDEGKTLERQDIVWGLGDNGNDGIRVTGTVHGTVNFYVNPKSVDSAQEERIKLMEASVTDDEDFEAALVDKNGNAIQGLEIRGWDYTLVREDGEALDGQTGAGTEIYLSSLDSDNGYKNTTVNAGSYIGVAQAAQLFDLSLHDRMSSRSWLTAEKDGSIRNAFWAIENVSSQKFTDSTGQIDVRNKASTTIVGADLVSSAAGTGNWYAGILFGYAFQDTRSRSSRTNFESKADAKAWSAGVYAGWQQNPASRTGAYVDSWLMWTQAESDIKGVSVSETAKGSGLSASVEAGWGFHVLDYDLGQLYLEPHLAVTWFGYGADSISNETHDVTFSGENNVRTKLGVKAYAFAKNANDLTPYFEVNWIHNTETYGANISGVNVEQAGADDLVETRTGFDWAVNSDWTVWGHVGYALGTDRYSEFDALAGVRYSF